MAYINLETIKKHLNIDSNFSNDDGYLMILEDVAEKVVQRHICCVLSDIEDSEGNLPTPLNQSILLYIGVLYNSRESISYGGNPTNVPFTFQYLLDMYKNYADTTSDTFISNTLDKLAKSTLLSDTTEEEEIAPYGDVAVSTTDKAVQRIAENTSIDSDGNFTVGSIERI